MVTLIYCQSYHIILSHPFRIFLYFFLRVLSFSYGTIILMLATLFLLSLRYSNMKPSEWNTAKVWRFLHLNASSCPILKIELYGFIEHIDLFITTIGFDFLLLLHYHSRRASGKCQGCNCEMEEPFEALLSEYRWWGLFLVLMWSVLNDVLPNSF